MDRRIEGDIKILNEIIKLYQFYGNSEYVMALTRARHCLEYTDRDLYDYFTSVISAEHEIDELIDSLKAEKDDCIQNDIQYHISASLREDVAVIGLGDAGINFISRCINKGIFPKEKSVVISRNKARLNESGAGEKIHLFYQEELVRFEQRRGVSATVMKNNEKCIKETIHKLGCQRVAIVFAAGGAYADGIFSLINILRDSIGVTEVYPFAFLPFSFEGNERCVNARAICDRLSSSYKNFCVENDDSYNACSRRTTINEAMELLDNNMLNKFRACALL